MTIAVGMVCTDGVLICADTRQTVEGECIWEDTKMMKGTSERFGDYIVAGCGNTSYIYMAFDSIEKALGSTRNSKTDFAEVLRNEIAKIHRHIHACHHSDGPAPWLELIIGIHKPKLTPLLFHVESTGAITPVTDKIFMGSGRPIAAAFARIMLTEKLPLELARFAAFFFMYQAKQSGYGTGGETQVCYLPRPTSMGLWDDKEMAEGVEQMMRLFLLDTRNVGISNERFDDKIKDAFQKMLAIRRSVLRNRLPKD